ncbi:hypothetical protein A2U01_0035647, partial [Trifolium medium]|nr:hypothetical protein [Trifolium medium]
VSTKRHSIHQEKEAAKKLKLETTKAAENEVDEKQNAESTEDGKAIAAEMHEVDSADDDAYEDLLRSIEGPDWEDKFYTLSSTDAEDGDVLSFPSISVEDSEEASFSRRLN